MFNYKINIQYDGTDYNGWQKQKNTRNTIQWRFERIISELNGYETEVIGSGPLGKVRTGFRWQAKDIY